MLSSRRQLVLVYDGDPLEADNPSCCTQFIKKMSLMY